MTAFWRETTLGTEIDLLYGKSLAEARRRRGSVPVYGSNGRVGWHDEALVEGPGVVVGRKGSVGAVAFSETAFWPIDTTYYVRNAHGHDWLFLYYLLRHLPLDRLNSHTAVPGLNREAALSTSVVLPPREEQTTIAGLLRQVERAVDLESRLIATTRELKQAAMEQLFTRGLSGRETAHDGYPENWVPRLFQELAILHRGYDLPVSVRVAGDVPVIGSNGVVGYHNEVKRAGPGVVVGRSGTMGKSFFCEGPYWPLNTGLFVVDFKGNRPLFVHYFIQAFDFSPYVAGVSVPTLNRNLVHQVPVRVPSLDEQEKIAAILRAVDAATALHERKRALLAELFEALLHDLMTGSVRVDHLDVAGNAGWVNGRGT